MATPSDEQQADVTDKPRIRQQFLAARQGLLAVYRDEASKCISATLLDWLQQQGAQTVATYAAHRDEVNLSVLHTSARAVGMAMAFPKVQPHRQMQFYVVNNDEELQRGAYGVFEPQDKHDSAQPILPTDVDVVLVPGVVFDRSGARIGYGGGYYDRWLATAGNLIRVGIAYEMQIAKHLDMGLHDVRMDFLVSEKGMVTCQR